ncbi:MAG: gamma-glutamyltransferase [Thermodesulfobacteriota bacterium]|nr:gamma-glutamyltransferase [Thermodesulfobacteriota bacterium]
MNIGIIEKRFNETPDRKCAIAKNGMVASAFPEATQAGIEMLERGGNAVDAACATALALGVCEPQASGIGGQTMAILYFNGNTIALDGSSRVPSLAHLSRFKKGQRTIGYCATTIPSTIAVLGYLNFQYGRLKWPEILEPAIRIAQEGYRITQLQHDLQLRELEKFLKVPSKSGARYFLKNGKEPYQVGDLFVQPDLYNLLIYLSENGVKSFYQGLIAQRIDKDMKNNEGFLRAEDLALIPWPIERKPLRRNYRNVTLATIPPPAAGRTMLLVLMMLNYLPLKYIRNASPKSYHFIAEIFRKAFLYRKQRPYDPNTFFQISDQKMISHSFARQQAKSIRDMIDPTLPIVEPPDEETETTHLSVMDKEGNAIGITQSIELTYGSKAAADGLGFLYNNYMEAFETKDPSHPYYLRPNAAPWTSVVPTIVFYKNKPWIVTGSPGSERIYSTVSQFLINMIDRGLSMGEAMESPRFHCSIGGKISIEADRFEPAIIEYLEKMGYKIDRRYPYDFFFGAIHAVMKCHTKDEFHGIAEIRRDGTAGGV